MTSLPFTLRWGILATGGIATTFTKDLLIDPETRSAGDIRHVIAAAASSTSASRARDFLSSVNAPSSSKAYGSYKELVQDKDVDIVYVATPHSHHYQHTRLALEAGKHVLVEKPITVNAQQCAKLRQLAQEKNKFLMEAVWTRFFPLSREICNLIQNGSLGNIVRVYADFSFWNDVPTEFDTQHRMINPELAGGALLDLGIYSLTWVFMALYHTQQQQEPATAVKKREEPVVSSAVTKYETTGVDQTTTVLLHFPSTGAHGVASTSIQVATTPNPAHASPDAIRIQGTLGDLTVNYAPRPRTYTLIPAGNEKRGQPAPFAYQVVTKHEDIPGGGHGMFWEADECARCIRDGKLESGVCGLEETEVVMRVMDQVRRQGGVVYPEGIESLEFPLGGFGL
ncbi:NAD(P)-binding protein [Decorospora gaudefroyi]|uniref:D-xylose 1-dehydrogenase (NADP(+), D-xylono-1,5-lactone-forming) n=1 Tax=Decorospora gaudefroyi TaxID=184978 RepID=A0A6A5K4Z7_9PLEO|nr:NAD(P)-binding protein [Decorospora gaudefroyi]